MSWLFPGFLAGALAVAVPIALHLLRRWPRRAIAFPSLQFLTSSSVRIESVWQRLRRWLVLAARCLVFLLLAAAFARPFRATDAARQSRAVVVVIDNSFSLQAQGRWDTLRRWAREKLGTFAYGDRLGLLLMAPQPTWLVAPTDEIARPLQAFDSLTPGWLTARAEPALRLASDTLAAIPADRREIIVIGDHQRVSWSGTDFSRKLAPGVETIFPPLPPVVRRQAALLPPSLGMTASGITASVTIHNFTDRQKRTLRVYRDGSGAPLGEKAVELAPGEIRAIKLNLPSPGDRTAYFRFSLDEDDLPADDSAYAVWQASADGALLLDAAPPGTVTDFARDALQAASDVAPKLHLKTPPSEEWPSRAVAVLRNGASFAGADAARLDAFLAGGGAALIFASGGPDERSWLAARGVSLAPLAGAAGTWQVHGWAMDHPLVTELSRCRLGVLLGWQFKGGWGMPANAVTPLAHWSENAAAIGEVHVGAGTLLICAFSPDRRNGDWPLAAGFVPFLHQAASYLFQRQHSATVAGETGRVLLLPGAAGNWRAVEGPEKGKAAIQISGSVLPLAPGVYEFSRGKETMLFAVNLPPEESDPAGWDAGTPWLGLASPQPAAAAKTAPMRAAAAADAEQRTPLWWWAVAAVAILMLAELGMANRTAR